MRKLLLASAFSLLASASFAQQVTTPPIVALACAYNSGAQTGTSGQFMYVQCDVNGKVLTSGTGLTVGTTTISGGTNGRCLYDNVGVLGEQSCATAGGSNTQLQYNNSSAFGGISGWTTNGTTTLTGGASTTLAIGGATIGSNALAVTGAANISGALVLGDGALAAPSLAFVAQPGTGFWRPGSASVGVSVNGSSFLRFTGTSVVFLRSDADVSWSSNTSFAAADVSLSRSGAGILQLGNGALNALGSLNLTNLTGTGTIIIGTGDATTSTGGALQVTGGASIAKRLWIPAITASAGLQTAVLCQSSGGEMIADSVACLASSEKFKEDISPSDMGLATVLALRPITYRYRKTGNVRFDSAPNQRAIHAGFSAEQAALVDPRLVAYDADGNIRTIRPDAVPAALVLAIQELSAKVDRLQVHQ